MNATRAAALSIHRTENYARSRPRLHVVYRAEGSLATAPPAALPAALPAAAPPVDAPRKAPPPVAVPPAAPRPDAAPRPARHMPAAQSAASPLRLTRRGRVVVAGLAVLLVSVLSLLVAGAAQATSHAAPPLSAAGHGLGQVVVRPGQSLWSVAESADPDADTRLVIQQILKLNALNGDTVFAGQQLWVPRD